MHEGCILVRIFIYAYVGGGLRVLSVEHHNKTPTFGQLKDDGRMGKTYLLAIGLFLGFTGGCLFTQQAHAQADIAVFSKMMDADDAVDPNEPQDKNYPSLENIVRGLRTFPGLDGDKPFTMFVPNNEAFKKLPANTIQYFTNSDNKKALDELVSFHVIAGKVSYGEIKDAIKKNNGRALFKTISGYKLFAKLNDKGDVLIENEAGKEIKIMAYNFHKGNGLIHVVDSVIIPYDAGLIEEELKQVNKLD